MQRDSLQFEPDIDEMASWTRSHRRQPDMQDWLAEYVPSAYALYKAVATALVRTLPPFLDVTATITG
jgi:hypothetical protein